MVVFDEGQMPTILRPADDRKDQYYIVRECFIHDIAEGQVYDALEKKSVKERMFELV